MLYGTWTRWLKRALFLLKIAGKKIVIHISHDVTSCDSNVFSTYKKATQIIDQMDDQLILHALFSISPTPTFCLIFLLFVFFFSIIIHRNENNDDVYVLYKKLNCENVKCLNGKKEVEKKEYWRTRDWHD